MERVLQKCSLPNRYVHFRQASTVYKTAGDALDWNTSLEVESIVPEVFWRDLPIVMLLRVSNIVTFKDTGQFSFLCVLTKQVFSDTHSL